MIRVVLFNLVCLERKGKDIETNDIIQKIQQAVKLLFKRFERNVVKIFMIVSVELHKSLK